MIFEQLLESTRLAPNRPPVSKAASLYRLALTCRKFTDPAVALLWESQHGVMPLLKCLPSRKWEIFEGSFVSRSAYLRIGRHHECNSVRVLESQRKMHTYKRQRRLRTENPTWRQCQWGVVATES
ncbi:hypothetical protein C8F04DRAFT_1074931 [Mycena alexandri]|uniref:Uncharacterized protein n=1 Tax=Mycena alexandri TaxID=1745969 RepID=A0AAD6TCZ5_9AGAR|nr:hypothetical protein C8F04DRAFT_1074931 [Mycena alexandri]